MSFNSSGAIYSVVSTLISLIITAPSETDSLANGTFTYSACAPSSFSHPYTLPLTHRPVNPRWQKKQSPHDVVKGETTRSPLEKVQGWSGKAGPREWMWPQNSWP